MTIEGVRCFALTAVIPAGGSRFASVNPDSMLADGDKGNDCYTWLSPSLSRSLSVPDTMSRANDKAADDLFFWIV